MSLMLPAMMMLAMLLASVAAMAQNITVRGIAKDKQGQPYVGATIELTSTDNGRKYDLKSDKHGEFSTIILPNGKYDVKLIVDGQTLWQKNFLVSFSTPPGMSEAQHNFLDLDLSHQQSTGMTEEQKKVQEEAQKKNAEAVKENAKIGNLNKLMADANTAAQGKNFDEALTLMKQATAADPGRDLLWGKQAEYQYDLKQFPEAEESIKKAVDLAQSSNDVKVKARVGVWHNLYGQILSGQKKAPEAMQQYDAAAQSDPQNAAMYHFNAGAILTNMQKVDDANLEFDKAIAADPNYAEAYYQKGVNLLQKMKTDAAGKIIAPEGTADAFNKYLELKPDGPNAEGAKALLAQMGETVTIKYGKEKSATKKK
jgi:tetratricopeptide (TPR) repeat protein